MINSMTGFAAVVRASPHGQLNLELRSVNHRYLEVQLRLPEELRALEPALREAITRAMSRGKVDCRISLAPSTEGAPALQLNQALLEQLLHLNAAVKAALPASQELAVADVLRWPGMLVGQEISAEALRESCEAALAEALEQFNASRRREGEKLKALLLERTAAMEKLLAELEPVLPQVLEAWREKLRARFQEVLASLDEDRIRQELAVFANRVDVDEELSRLRTHIAELRRILQAGGAAGKRLDFLMQELHREANTLGSKSASTEVSRTSMELKVLIEQMREQVQNIE